MLVPLALGAVALDSTVTADDSDRGLYVVDAVGEPDVMNVGDDAEFDVIVTRMDGNTFCSDATIFTGSSPDVALGLLHSRSSIAVWSTT